MSYPDFTNQSFENRRKIRSARTLEQRKNDYIQTMVDYAIDQTNGAIYHCPGEYEHGQYTIHGEEAAEEAALEAAREWDLALQLWNKTPTEYGDEKYEAVETKYGDDLANEMADLSENCNAVGKSFTALNTLRTIWLYTGELSFLVGMILGIVFVFIFFAAT
jgi:hypothetical protein